MSKKQLDTASITSELRGQSAFFPVRADERSVPTPAPETAPSSVPSPAPAPAFAADPVPHSAGSASEQQVFPPHHRPEDPTSITPAAAAAGRTPVPPFGSPPAPSSDPSVERPPVRPTYPMAPLAPTPPLRTITRYAFEFYQDQIETLRALSLEQKFQGQKGSMSEMVREALDAYIAQLRRAQG